MLPWCLKVNKFNSYNAILQRSNISFISQILQIGKKKKKHAQKQIQKRSKIFTTKKKLQAIHVCL